MKYKIKKLEKTTYACPTQFEGKLEDGRAIYIRYRWGCLSIRVSDKKTNDIMKAVSGKEIYSKQISDELDGVIELDEILKLANDVIE